jgi:pimeloyl-ACP methyl ester carboxylesterase
MVGPWSGCTAPWERSDSCFAGLLPALAASRRVIAVELQGHGHTAEIDRPLSYRDMADDVAGLIEVLGVAPVDIVGFSMGGGVVAVTGGREAPLHWFFRLPPRQT